MRSKKLIGVLLITASILLSSCSYLGVQNESKYNVWFIAKSQGSEFWNSAFAGANAAKTEYNIDLHITGPETEEQYDRQNNMIDQMRSSSQPLATARTQPPSMQLQTQE